MKKLAVIFLGIIASVALLVGGFYIGQQISQQQSPSPSAVQTSSPAPTGTPAEQTGAIEGSIGYPSEVIPEDMIICAETLEGEVVTCTDEHIQDQKYTYREGYMLEVEPGTYYVYAQIPGDSYKAYYTEFVPCGLSVDCESHANIEVEVNAGETTSGVDPIDWYNRNQEPNSTAN